MHILYWKCETVKRVEFSATKQHSQVKAIKKKNTPEPQATLISRYHCPIFVSALQGLSTLELHRNLLLKHQASELSTSLVQQSLSASERKVGEKRAAWLTWVESLQLLFFALPLIKNCHTLSAASNPLIPPKPTFRYIHKEACSHRGNLFKQTIFATVITFGYDCFVNISSRELVCDSHLCINNLCLTV